MAFLVRLMERTSVRKRAPDLAELRTLIAPISGVHLLDVGGGAGAATEQFATGCAEVVVLEPDRRSSRRNCFPPDSKRCQTARASRGTLCWGRNDVLHSRWGQEDPASLSASSAPSRMKAVSWRAHRLNRSRET